MRLGLSRFLTIRQPGFVLRFYPSSLCAALWIDPADHQAEAVFFGKYLRPGDVVIDVGANVGLTTLAAARAVGDSGRVIAIEPHPRIFRYLRENVALNRAANVSLHNFALGNAEGTLLLSDMSADDHNFIAPGAGRLQVPVRRLDQLPIDSPRIDLLKIDVEGYENYVLQGAAATLQKTVCVYFESWDQHFAKYGYVCSEVLGCLAAQGFGVYRFSGENRIQPVPGSYTSPVAENLVALRKTEDFLERTGFRLDAG